MPEKNQKKIRIVLSLFCVLFLLIIAKAFFIQVINKKKLLEYSEGQFIRESTVFPQRGNIYDRNDNPLAINIQTYNIFVMPKSVVNKNQTFRKLAKIIPGVKVSVLKKRLKNRTRFTWIKRQVSLDDKQVVQIKELKGIFLEKIAKRFYPNNELMAQVLGFVGVDNIGLAGIEHQFDKLLKGDAKIIKYLQDAKGRTVKFESYNMEHKAQSLELTLDKDIQAVAEKYLKQAIKEHQASRGGVGIMDASTGEIIALTNYPTFDSNRGRLSDQSYHRLPFITDPFEPGSVFKIFTVASALENKIVTPETNYFCEHGRLEVGNHIISESESSKKYEWLSVVDIIKYSSNIGTVKIAFDLTFPLLDETIKKFGFGKKTKIEIPGESRGIYNNDKEKISLLSLSNLSFGQGVATTAIQMLTAYAAIANGGVYYQPTIVKSIDGEPIKRKEGKRIIAEDIALELQKMLMAVVEEGTAQNIKMPYFKIAGKTGTAQRADESGSYSGYIPNFVGFPLGVHKNFVVYAYIEEPKGKYYTGGKVVAPLVKNIMEYVLFKNKEYQNLATDIDSSDNSFVETLERVPATKKKFDKGVVPSFVGLDRMSSSFLAKKLGISLIHRGVGVVFKQSVKEGTRLLENMTIELDHEPPRYE